MTFKERLQFIPAKTKIYLSLVLVLVLSAGVFFLAQKYSADTDSEMQVSARVFALKDFTAIEGASATYTSSLDPSSQPVTVQSDANGSFNAILPTKYYDHISIIKDGYFDIEGSINFDSKANNPKEIVFNTYMEEGFGIKNVHYQTIMPGDNWITTPLVPKIDDPQNAFYWVDAVSGQKDGLDVKYLPVNNNLSKWQYTDQKQLTLTEANAEAFGKVTQGQSYNLKSTEDQPRVIQLDGTLPDTADINLTTAGTALVGNTSGKIQKLSDIGVTIGEDTYSLSDAISQGKIKDAKLFDTEDQKEIPISSPDVVIRPGQAFFLSTTKENTKLTFGQTITGHLQDSNGQPIVEASVSASTDSIESLDDMPKETKTNASGDYVLPVNSDKYNRIFISKNGFNSIEGTITDGQGNGWAILNFSFVLNAGDGTETAQIVPLKQGQTTSFGLSQPVNNILSATSLVKTADGYKEQVIPDKIDSFNLASQKTATVDPEKFNSSDTDILNTQTTRSTAVTSSYDNNTYIFGGWDKTTNTPTDTIYQYDTKNNTITVLDTVLPNATAGAASVEMAGSNKIIIIGGTLINNLRSFMIYAFNPEDQTIMNYGTLPEHERYQAFHLGERYYLFGEDNNKLTVYYLNEDLTGISGEPIFVTNKVGLGTTILTKNYKLYFLGGLKDGVPTNEIYSLPFEGIPYADDSSLTKETTTLPYPVAFPSTMTNTNPDYFYLFGGQTNATDFTNQSMAVTFADNNINVKKLDFVLPYASGDVAFAKDYWSNLNIFSSTADKYNQKISYAATLMPGQMYSVTASKNYALVLRQNAVNFDTPDTTDLQYAPTEAFYMNNPGTAYKFATSGVPENLLQYKLTNEGNEYNLIEGAQNNLIQPKVYINHQEINLPDLTPVKLRDYVVNTGDVFTLTDKADTIVTKDGDQLDPAYYTGYILIPELVKKLQEAGAPDNIVSEIIYKLDACVPSYFDRTADQTQRDACLDSIQLESDTPETEESPVTTQNNTLQKYSDYFLPKAKAITDADTQFRNLFKPLIKGTVIPGTPKPEEFNVNQIKDPKTRKFIAPFYNKYFGAQLRQNIKILTSEPKIVTQDWIRFYQYTNVDDNLPMPWNSIKYYGKYKHPFFYKEYWDNKNLNDLYTYYFTDLRQHRYNKEFTQLERHRLELAYKTGLNKLPHQNVNGTAQESIDDLFMLIGVGDLFKVVTKAFFSGVITKSVATDIATCEKSLGKEVCSATTYTDLSKVTKPAIKSGGVTKATKYTKLPISTQLSMPNLTRLSGSDSSEIIYYFIKNRTVKQQVDDQLLSLASIKKSISIVGTTADDVVNSNYFQIVKKGWSLTDKQLADTMITDTKVLDIYGSVKIPNRLKTSGALMPDRSMQLLVRPYSTSEVVRKVYLHELTHRFTKNLFIYQQGDWTFQILKFGELRPIMPMAEMQADLGMKLMGKELYGKTYVASYYEESKVMDAIVRAIARHNNISEEEAGWQLLSDTVEFGIKDGIDKNLAAAFKNSPIKFEYTSTGYNKRLDTGSFHDWLYNQYHEYYYRRWGVGGKRTINEIINEINRIN